MSNISTKNSHTDEVMVNQHLIRGRIPVSRDSSIERTSDASSSDRRYALFAQEMSADTASLRNVDKMEMSITDMVRRLWESREVCNAIEDYDKELFGKIANCIFR
ncbi:hypothetical protein RB195_012896 [Necator americanus]|uniref:Uncharacterized protein n=1 Tax=Necator americanus TaxID=51031 RepID=A0ABR1DT23_NECAM